MALRELLSSLQRDALEAIPLDRAGLIEHYVLSDQDLASSGVVEELRIAWVLPYSWHSSGIRDARSCLMRPRPQNFLPSWHVNSGFLQVHGQAMQSAMKLAGNISLSCSFTMGCAPSASDTIARLRPG